MYKIFSLLLCIVFTGSYLAMEKFECSIALYQDDENYNRLNPELQKFINEFATWDPKEQARVKTAEFGVLIIGKTPRINLGPWLDEHQSDAEKKPFHCIITAIKKRYQVSIKEDSFAITDDE